MLPLISPHHSFGCRGVVLTLLALALLLPAPVRAAPPAGPAAKERTVLYIQPLGRALPRADVELVVRALRSFYSLPVKLLPRVKLPRAAYYPPRRRYRAEKLLDFLQKRLPADGFRILGLTGVDISTTKGRYKDWGILGLALLDDRVCVISAFRARKGTRSRRHGQIRLAKVAVHEIGHTLGLPHCPTRGCLMEDARGKVATCDREYDLCPRCRARLERTGHTLPKNPEIPWPRPR